MWIVASLIVLIAITTPEADSSVLNEDICGTVTISRSTNSGSDIPRVVNGSRASSGQWPWQAMVLLIDDNVASLVCGGTLINSGWVVTAAHCFSGESPFQTGILLGANAVNSPSESARQRFNVKNITCHPTYGGEQSTFVDDICLMQLDGTATFNDYVRPACLPSSGVQPKVGELCTVSGWGETENTGNSNFLQYAEVGVLSRSNCMDWYSAVGITVPSDHFCAGYEEGLIDTCQGDSGGPLACPESVSGGSRYILRGITSFGYGCADPMRPGVYTNVVQYLDWIEHTVMSGGASLHTYEAVMKLQICLFLCSLFTFQRFY